MSETEFEHQEIEHFVIDLINTKSFDKTKIIPILQAIQQKFGYLSRSAITTISQTLRIPEIDVFGVATFYAQFRFNKPGRYPIKVCEGTACHVRGGKAISQTIERELNITSGETSEDGMFSLERVACLGCCALAPVMVVGDEVYGTVVTGKISEILNKKRAEE